MVQRSAASTRGGMILACLAASVAGATTVSADTLSLVSDRDNTLYQVEPTDQELSSGAGAFMFCGVTSTLQVRRALVRFDLRAIPAGSMVQSASLRLNVSRAASGGSSVFELHRALADWGEGSSDAGDPGGGGAAAAAGDATWFHRRYPDTPWSAPGGDSAPAPSAAATGGTLGALTWSSAPGLVADVQSWVNNPDSNSGWFVTTEGGARRFDTRENLDPLARPMLTVVFAPPCTADFNRSGSVTVQDIFDFLAAYFTGAPAADVNRSGAVTVQDVFDFLAAYFTGC